MALDAIHIRARSGSPQRYDDYSSKKSDWQSNLKHPREPQTTSPLTSSPPFRPSIRPAIHRPGIGSYPATKGMAHDDNEWRSLRTGGSRATQAMRTRPRFVRATQLSEPSLAPIEQVAPNSNVIEASLTKADDGIHQDSSLTFEPPSISAPTMAQLYSQLAQDMPTTVRAEASSSKLPSTPASTHPHQQGRNEERPRHHDHHHQHHPTERQRSEWFISKAMTKMRRSKELSLTRASASTQCSTRVPTDQADEAHVDAARASRCQRCGDLLPSNPTQEELARHRQSIGHRLGLNPPVSSASASEAPSPDASEAPTPTHNSRSASPPAVSLLDASMQALHRRSGKLPRRFSNAPRWKKISRDNVGHNLLSRMGWKEGMGLGVQEWKWQQLRREKIKRQKSNAVRALLQRDVATAQVALDAEQNMTAQVRVTEPEWMQLLARQDDSAASAGPPSLTTYFPFQHDSQDAAMQREAVQAWLFSLPPADLEWFQCLTADEQQALELALLAGHITLQDIQDALHDSAAEHMSEIATTLVTGPSSEVTNGMEQSNALLYPVQVELRADRSGIGSRQPSQDSSVRQRRRLRVAEGSVEIRRPSSPSPDNVDGGHKKLRSHPTERAPRPLGRSRSHSISGSGKSQAKHTDLTCRKREAAYRKEKQEWLDLRASLS